MTAAATTGPAKQPLPASSKPASLLSVWKGNILFKNKKGSAEANPFQKVFID